MKDRDNSDIAIEISGPEEKHSVQQGKLDDERERETNKKPKKQTKEMGAVKKIWNAMDVVSDGAPNHTVSQIPFTSLSVDPSLPLPQMTPRIMYSSLSPFLLFSFAARAFYGFYLVLADNGFFYNSIWSLKICAEMEKGLYQNYALVLFFFQIFPELVQSYGWICTMFILIRSVNLGLVG